MSMNRMLNWRSMAGASLVALALAAFSFAPNAIAAGGGGGGHGGGGGGFSGGHSGGGFGGGGFSGGHSGGGFSGGHSGGGFSGGGSFARPSVGSGQHSATFSPTFSPNGSHSSTGFPGGGSVQTTHPLGPHGGPGWSQSSGNWHNGNWNGGNWNRGQYYGSHWNWYRNGNSFIYPYFFSFVPVYGYGYGYGYGYPYFDYGGTTNYYAVYYNGGDDALPPADGPQAVDPGVQVAPEANAAPQAGGGAAPVADGNDVEANAGAEYFAQAEAAFQEGRYHDALRLANHAAVEAPRNPKAHELMSLSMFALADYRGAAIEAHAAIGLGPIADWATVFGYYGDQVKYTTQLRALEKYSHENPKSAEARFLRAYHYLMIGQIAAAKEQLAEAVKLTPNDKLAAELLKKYNGDAPVPLPPPLDAVPAAPPAAPAKPVVPDPDSFDT